MKLRLSWVQWVVIFLLVVGGLQYEAHSARAFEPKPDYWFIETLTISQVGLPAGVTIQSSDPAQFPHAYLFLQNQSETPLYVMSLNYKDVLVMATPDLNWKLRVSLAHEAASYLVAPAKPVYLTMLELVDLDHNLVNRNMLNADPPPPDLTAPEGQSSELLLVYDGQVIEVPFTLTYTVNPNYDNGSRFYWAMMTSIQATTDASSTATQQAQMVRESQVREDIIVVGLAGAALVIVLWLAWMGWRGFSRRS